MRAPEQKHLIFISSHRRHPKVADRLVGALAAGRQVHLYAFDRGSVDHPVYADPRISNFSLGPVRDGLARSHMLALVRAFRVLYGARGAVAAGNTVVIANTLEVLLLGLFCGLTRLPTIYDVADIHVLLLSPSLKGRLARWLERQALKRVALLVVTSPWFFWEYFRARQNASNTALLIENKVSMPLRPLPQGGRFRRKIAWNGLLRCRRSAAMLLECLRSAPGAFHLSLHGRLSGLGEHGRMLLAESGNCSYTGSYQPDSLVSLLQDSSFMWAVDYAEGESSRWLLPNRLYEAIAAGLPLIAVDDSATGAVVSHYRIGMVLSDCTPQALLAAMDECTATVYAQWCANLAALRQYAERSDEWRRVFDDTASWNHLPFLPSAADVRLVLKPNAA